MAVHAERGGADVTRRQLLLAESGGLRRNPRDLGYGHIIKFDHEFVGRAALQANLDQPHRRKVTLLWHPDDVLAVYGRLLGEGPTAMHIDLPVSATARMHYDKVLDGDGDHVGFGTYPGYSYNERAMMSLGTSMSRSVSPAPSSR